MPKNMRFLYVSIVLMIGILLSCRSSRNDMVKVTNSSPVHAPGESPGLHKLYEIDVTRISMFSRESSRGFENVIDFDENDQMYVLDGYESTITVFNKKGEYVKSFGRRGQGPKEFIRPYAMLVHKNKIYMFQGFNELKIVDLNGEYISSQIIHIENPLKYNVIGDDFYVYSGKTDRTFTKLEFILQVENDAFSESDEIFRYDYPPGLRGPNYDFVWPSWILITPNGEFYFPEDNLNKYSIIKYNRQGKAKIIFDRKYDIKEYSHEAKDRFSSIYKQQISKGDMVFPPSPPVVRNMFLDEKSDLWVISGETSEDNGNPEYENSIDIFNERGEWLYFFKSKNLSKQCLYNNGKIYRILPINPDTYKQYIEVYEIKY